MIFFYRISEKQHDFHSGETTSDHQELSGENNSAWDTTQTTGSTDYK